MWVVNGNCFVFAAFRQLALHEEVITAPAGKSNVLHSTDISTCFAQQDFQALVFSHYPTDLRDFFMSEVLCVLNDILSPLSDTQLRLEKKSLTEICRSVFYTNHECIQYLISRLDLVFSLFDSLITQWDYLHWMQHVICRCWFLNKKVFWLCNDKDLFFCVCTMYVVYIL